MPCTCESDVPGAIQSFAVMGDATWCLTCRRQITVSTRPAPAKSCVSADCWAPDCGCAHLKRHPNSARFHELLELAGQRHDEKQADYGKGEDPFANVRASEDWGVPGWVGTMIRLSDKVKRLQAFAERGELTGEAADNDFVDIAVYALIAYVLWEQENK